jgi:hypothetical protein
MPKEVNPRDPDTWPSEDDIQREKLGPRGVPGEPYPNKMTPERKKKTPTEDTPPGHTA